MAMPFRCAHPLLTYFSFLAVFAQNYGRVGQGRPMPARKGSWTEMVLKLACLLRNKYCIAKGNFLFRDILLRGSEESVPPKIVEISSDISINEGGNISLTCIATGRPDPTINWRHISPKEWKGVHKNDDGDDDDDDDDDKKKKER
ncbi:hypothetical protein L345_05972, partial [Ophiophagus hannah]